jgi:hypothetical protein
MSESNRAFSIVMFYVLNPTAALTTPEIGRRFNVATKNVQVRLRIALINGLLEKRPPPPGSKANTYVAGEALLKMRARFTETA